MPGRQELTWAGLNHSGRVVLAGIIIGYGQYDAGGRVGEMDLVSVRTKHEHEDEHLRSVYAFVDAGQRRER